MLQSVHKLAKAQLRNAIVLHFNEAMQATIKLRVLLYKKRVT
jgi:hypothetical protein